MGTLIAIEGIDGSGKGTQAKLLVEALQDRGRTATLLGFPRYSETFFGARIGEFLNGRFGTLAEVDPFLVSLLFAGDRFESRDLLAAALANSDYVVLDRYVASNIAHQAAKLGGEERDRLIGWIEHLEFTVYGLPRPDRVILFDLPAAIAQTLIAQKSRRDYTDSAADLQEADTHYQMAVRELYLSLCSRDPRWRRISVTDDRDGLRPIAQITADVLTALDPLL